MTVESVPLIPTFLQTIWCFSPGESLATALRYMRDEDFSQVVAQREGKLCLLSAEGITRWLADQNEPVDLDGVTVGDVLPYDPPDGFRVLGAAETVESARHIFQRGPRVFAVIITEHGTATETPLGIVTPWDVLEEVYGANGWRLTRR
jgi:predicted transcriptional regulator